MILSQQRRIFAALLAVAVTAPTVAGFSTTSSSSGLSFSQLASTSQSSDLLLDRREAFVKSSAAIAAATGVSLLPSFTSPASAAATNKIPEWTLENGVKFPKLALNTVGLSVEDTNRALTYAVAAGVKHVDFHPGKERDGVAQYIKENPGSRNKLFLNTKIRKAPPGTSPSEAAERTRNQIDEDLAALGVSSVDMLMLRDSPDCEVIQAQWAVLEEALAQNRCRSIGVINFCEKALTCVLQTAKVKPALNYYMLHVGMGTDPRSLRSFGESRGIRTFAYGAAGEPGPNEQLLSSPVLKRIGDAHGKKPEEVALRWVTQNGCAVSVRPTLDFGLGTGMCTEENKCKEGFKARASTFGWSLTKGEMEELNALTSPNDNPTLFSSAGCPDSFVMKK